MNVLRIYFSALWRDSSSPCPWAICDDAGIVVQQGESKLTDIPKTRECIAIIAADRVLNFTTQPPPGNKRLWQTALPFIAEEHALSDPDDLHAVPAPAPQPGLISVSVIKKPWLKHIITATAAAGLPLRRMLAETLLPELKPDTWTLVWNGSSGFLQTSATTGLALDEGNLTTPPLALTLSLHNAKDHLPQCITLRSSESHEVMPDWNLPAALEADAPWDWRQEPISKDAPNLLWGNFAPPMRLLDGLSKLRPALYILLAALVIEVAGTHIQWLMLAHEKSTLQQQMEQTFRSAFGDDSALINPPLQMQRNLAALRHNAGVSDNSDFLALLDATTQALGGINERAIRGLNYDSGKLELDLKLPRADEFKALSQKMQNLGLRVNISGMNDAGDGTQAKLTLSQEVLR